MKLFKRLLLGGLFFVLVPASAGAQITGLNTFSPNTRILSADVNFNFTKLADEACRRQGCTLTGNMTVSSGVTIDGIDLSAWLDQSVQTTASPTFAALTITGAGTYGSTLGVTGDFAVNTNKFTVAASTGNTLVAGTLTVTGAADFASSAEFGSGNVTLIGADGKINGPFSSTNLDDLDGTNFTGIAKLGSNNAFTARNDLRTYSETRTAPTIAAGALTIDLDAGTLFEVDLDANITSITVSNPVPNGSHGAFTIKFVADGTIRDITWPASFKWVGGTEPAAMTGTNGYKDFVTCVYDDGGTSYNCVINQGFPS